MKKLSVVWAMLIFLLLPLMLSAGSFSSIVAFGDSLSDNGPAEDGYGFGTFSNGPVWVEYLADSNHLNCDLYDYAYGGATTGDGPEVPGVGLTGLNWQVDQFLSGQFQNSPLIADNVLFTVWAGGNDFLNMGVGDDPYQVAMDAVLNIGFAVTKLAEMGAKNIMVANLPNLGATPLYNWNDDLSSAAQELTIGFNAGLATGMTGMEAYYSDVNFYMLDAYGILEGALGNSQDFGFDNVNEPLYDTTGYPILPPTLIGNPDLSYLFWDGIHPTTQAHALIADYAQSEVAPVPEPATMILLGSGLLGIAGMRRKIFRA